MSSRAPRLSYGDCRWCYWCTSAHADLLFFLRVSSDRNLRRISYHAQIPSCPFHFTAPFSNVVDVLGTATQSSPLTEFSLPISSTRSIRFQHGFLPCLIRLESTGTYLSCSFRNSIFLDVLSPILWDQIPSFVSFYWILGHPSIISELPTAIMISLFFLLVIAFISFGLDLLQQLQPALLLRLAELFSCLSLFNLGLKLPAGVDHVFWLAPLSSDSLDQISGSMTCRHVEIGTTNRATLGSLGMC